MKVRATRIGFDGLCRRKEGDVFEFAGELGSWMEPADEGAQAEQAKRDAKKARDRAQHAKAKREQIGSTAAADAHLAERGSSKAADSESDGKVK